MNHSFDIIKKVRRTIAAHTMLDPGDKVVVAVSGGPDSACLLDILDRLRPEWRLQLVVAHLDHGLRPVEDEAETRFVQELAMSRGLIFETAQARLDKSTPCLEEKAREARLAFLEEVRQKHAAQKIGLGHHLNDQAETVLMRLLRGSGAKGLAGIPARRGAFIRPLIELEALEIKTYLEERGLAFMMDSSNLRPDFLRNKIRLDLLPRLLEYQPRLVRRLGRLAGLLQEENAFLETLAKEWMQDHLSSAPDKPLALALEPFLTLPPILQKYVIRLLIKRLKKNLRRINLAHIQSILDLARNRRSGTWHLHLPNQVVVKKSYHRLLFSNQTDPAAEPFSFLIQGPGQYPFDRLGLVFHLQVVERSEFKPPDSPWQVFLDADRIAYPLEIRSARPGDRFQPLGLEGEKKLKRFFIDLKVPREKRGRIPVCISAGSVVWISGYRLDERYKVGPETKKVLRIEVSGAGKKDLEA